MNLRAYADPTRDLAVVSATVDMPRVGAWTADLVVASGAAMAGKVDLALSSNLTLKGTIVRAGLLEQLLHARLVAGAGGLRSFVKSRHYTSPTVRVVLLDVLRDVNEVLAGTSDRNVLNTQLQNWTTFEMPASQAIRCVLERAGSGIAWRHLPDGTLWVGRETWPESLVSDFGEVEGSTPETDVMALTMTVPGLLPGTTIGGRRIDSLEYRATGTGVSALAWLAP